RTVLAGSADGTAQLWEVKPDPPGQVFRGQEGDVQSMALSSDGKRTLTATYTSIRLWDAATGRLVKEPWQGNFPVSSIGFQPDGKSFFIVRHRPPNVPDHGEVLLVDAVTGEEICAPLRFPLRVHRATLSPSGRALLISSGASPKAAKLSLWD